VSRANRTASFVGNGTRGSGLWRINPEATHPWIIEVNTGLDGFVSWAKVAEVLYRPDAFAIVQLANAARAALRGKV
jgi:hypothetical protein